MVIYQQDLLLCCLVVASVCVSVAGRGRNVVLLRTCGHDLLSSNLWLDAMGKKKEYKEFKEYKEYKEYKEFRSSGVQEFRSSGVQEFRSSGVQEFRSWGNRK